MGSDSLPVSLAYYSALQLLMLRSLKPRVGGAQKDGRWEAGGRRERPSIKQSPVCRLQLSLETHDPIEDSVCDIPWFTGYRYAHVAAIAGVPLTTPPSPTQAELLRSPVTI